MAELENLQPDQLRELVQLLAGFTDQLAQEVDRLAEAEDDEPELLGASAAGASWQR
jgi:hypothetical protein